MVHEDRDDGDEDSDRGEAIRPSIIWLTSNFMQYFHNNTVPSRTTFNFEFQNEPIHGHFNASIIHHHCQCHSSPVIRHLYHCRSSELVDYPTSSTSALSVPASATYPAIQYRQSCSSVQHLPQFTSIINSYHFSNSYTWNLDNPNNSDHCPIFAFHQSYRQMSRSNFPAQMAYQHYSPTTSLLQIHTDQ